MSFDDSEEAAGLPPPPPPDGLDAAGVALWNSIVQVYDLGPGDLRTLLDASKEADLIAYIEADWVSKGKPTETRGSRNQIVAYPALDQLRHHRSTMKSLLAALKLPVLEDEEEDPGDYVRIEIGKMTKSEVGKAGAKARWKNRGITDGR